MRRCYPFQITCHIYTKIHQHLKNLTLKFTNHWNLTIIFQVIQVLFQGSQNQRTINWDKTQMLKKFPSDKIKIQKMPSFFFRELQFITVLLLVCDFYMSWSTSFVSLKLCVVPSIFDSVSFFLKFIFLFNKMHGLFNFKTS